MNNIHSISNEINETAKVLETSLSNDTTKPPL